MARSRATPAKAPLRLPWLFRRGGCDRALICLAVNGNLTVRELARATKTDSHKMWDIVERLRRSGLAVKRDRPGGRKYVSLNRNLPIYLPLRKLLLALDHHWPARRYANKTARWYMPHDSALTHDRLDYMFQSPVRSRILLFVAAVGETNLSTIYTLLGIGTTSAWLAVNHWERQRLLRSRRFKKHRLLSLNPDFVVAKELKALLRTIIASSIEYDELRAAARRQLRPILKAAGSYTQPKPRKLGRRS
jgi:biotin operon repressor